MIYDYFFGKKLSDMHYMSIRLDRKSVDDNSISQSTIISMMKQFLSDAYMDMITDTDLMDDVISALSLLEVNSDSMSPETVLIKYNDILGALHYKGYFVGSFQRPDLASEEIDPDIKILAYLIKEGNVAYGITTNDEEKGSVADVAVGFIRSAEVPSQECDNIAHINSDLTAYDLLDSSNQGYTYDATNLLDYIRSKGHGIIIIHFHN